LNGYINTGSGYISTTSTISSGTISTGTITCSGEIKGGSITTTGQIIGNQLTINGTDIDTDGNINAINKKITCGDLTANGTGTTNGIITCYDLKVNKISGNNIVDINTTTGISVTSTSQTATAIKYDGTIFTRSTITGESFVNTGGTASITALGAITGSSLTATDLKTGGSFQVVSANSGGHLVITGSDRSLKTNIVSLRSQTNVLSQLNPVSFNWINTAKYGSNVNLGFIAQEVNEVLPHICSWIGVEPERYMTYNPLALIPVLTASIKELSTTVAQQEIRMDAMQRRIDSLANPAT
jgi:hypothetical protein